MQVTILSCQRLVNGFKHITVPSHNALPGQYVYYQDKKLFIMGEQGGSEILLPPDLPLIGKTTLSLSDLQGEALIPPTKEQFTLLLGQENALAGLIFYLKKYRQAFHGLVLLGAKKHFPFSPCPSRQLILGMPNAVIAALPLLEDWGIPHRLACLEEMPGVYQGTVEELAEKWLKASALKALIHELI